MDNTLNLLSRRAGFNTALRHFKTTNAIASDVQQGYNLADVINEALADGSLARYQVRAVLNALLVDKFDYVFRAHNMEETIDTAEKVVDQVSKWTALQLVVSYHHPQAGLFVVNPKNPAHWEESLPLIKDELVVVYAGSVDGSLDDKTLTGAIDDFLKILYGKSIKDKDPYIAAGRRPAAKPIRRPTPAAERERAAQEAPAAAEAARPAEQPAEAAERPSGKRRITPRYSVIVSNELFHNGNVEAWKRIIQSYKAKYPDLDVLIWYENERINDINALFKWGKVKHGTPIMFSVVGEDIKEVRKLQRYLYEGASPRFEAFLEGGVDRVLDLF